MIYIWLSTNSNIYSLTILKTWIFYKYDSAWLMSMFRENENTNQAMSNLVGWMLTLPGGPFY